MLPISKMYFMPSFFTLKAISSFCGLVGGASSTSFNISSFVTPARRQSFQSLTSGGTITLTANPCSTSVCLCLAAPSLPALSLSKASTTVFTLSAFNSCKCSSVRVPTPYNGCTFSIPRLMSERQSMTDSTNMMVSYTFEALRLNTLLWLPLRYRWLSSVSGETFRP